MRLLFGLFIIAVVLVALIWFSVTHTDTGDRMRSVFGTAAPAEGTPAAPAP